MTGKNIIILILVLVLIFIIYLIFSKKSDTKTNSDGSTTTIPTFPSTVLSSVTGAIQGSFPLKKGSIGSRVGTLQTWLNSKGASLSPDNAFGNLTLGALQKYTGLSEVSESYFNTYVLSNSAAPSLLIGKVARAGANGCAVYRTDYKTYNTLYKNAAAGEFLGIVSKVNSTKQVYELGSDFIASMSCVSLRNE